MLREARWNMLDSDNLGTMSNVPVMTGTGLRTRSHQLSLLI